ncbi:histidine phosphatase family protein [Patescibacteria group bacterium]|nr:histidine phosphatase family protein [Patescibacteria group bacterium]
MPVLYDKKIVPGAFRQLTEEECRILFIRHETHTSNFTYSMGVGRLRQQGAALKAAGLSISATISSPADRALTAAYETKVGLMQCGYTAIDNRLVDLSMESPDMITKVRAEAEEHNMSPESYLFVICKTDILFRAIMARRGNEGAAVLREASIKYAGKTVLVSSHGGSRIEATIAAMQKLLTKDEVAMPKMFLVKGQMVELIINVSTGKLVEENYLLRPCDEVNKASQKV